MRIIKYLFLLLLLSLVASSIFVATQKEDFTVERSKLINSPKMSIYNYVNDSKNWKEWNSLAVEDSLIKIIPSENTIGKGSSLTWEGKNGNGNLQTIDLKENDSIAQKINFNGNVATISMRFKDTLGGTKVSWKAEGKMGFLFKVSTVFSGGASKVFGLIFEKSLENLDKKLDYEINTYTIKENGLIDLIVAFGIDNNNPMIDNLQKSGLKVLIQADWMEQTPLGKAEWIKLYGALFGKEKEAKTLFDGIVKEYNNVLQLVANKKAESTVLYGSIYQNKWYIAKGNSWVAQFMEDAKSDYLWANVAGTGSLGLSFEQVLEKAKTADYWIITGPFQSNSELAGSNPHYSEFDAFKNKTIYAFESKMGATGGTLFYELSPSRPDLVLKDYVKIFHPELLPDYSFTFAQKLN